MRIKSTAALYSAAYGCVPFGFRPILQRKRALAAAAAAAAARPPTGERLRVGLDTGPKSESLPKKKNAQRIKDYGLERREPGAPHHV